MTRTDRIQNDHRLTQISLVKFTDEQVETVAKHLDVSVEEVQTYLSGDVPRDADMERAFYAVTSMYPFRPNGVGEPLPLNLHHFDLYQQRAGTTAMYPGRGQSLCYPAMGLAGEAGEVNEKAKKIVRDRQDLFAQPNDVEREKIKKELGDVLWYIAAICHEAGLSMKDVAEANLKKLASRKERGVIHGDGDDR